MASEGWKCPECGRVYAPWVGECRHCPEGQTVHGSGSDPTVIEDLGGDDDEPLNYCALCGTWHKLNSADCRGHFRIDP